jgi:hypothetical protein
MPPSKSTPRTSILAAPSQPNSPSRYRLPVKTRSSSSPDEEKNDATSAFQEPCANTLGHIDRDRSVSTPTNNTKPSRATDNAGMVDDGGEGEISKGAASPGERSVAGAADRGSFFWRCELDDALQTACARQAVRL